MCISVYNIQCILYYNETEGKELTKLRENVVLLDFPSGTKEWAEKWYEAFTHVRLIFHLFCKKNYFYLPKAIGKKPSTNPD